MNSRRAVLIPTRSIRSCPAVPRLTRTVPLAAALITGVLTGCETPFDGGSSGEALLRQSVDEAIARELSDLPPGGSARRTPPQPPSEVAAALADRLDELEEIGPELGPAALLPQLDQDLTGGPQAVQPISLQWALAAAVENNLTVQIARLQPAINASDVIAAEAIFDAIFFTDVDLTKIDQPQTTPVLNGIPLGTPVQSNETYRFATGVQKPLTTGGSLEVEAALSRSQNNGPGVQLSPDPAYLSSVSLGLEQPLLRGFGGAVNTATIRIARNAERRSVEDLRRELLNLVFEVESAYWRLVLACQNLAIQEWRVSVGGEIRDRIESRQQLDALPSQYADAVSRLEQRRADVIRARRNVRLASDQLKTLINDARLSVGSETLLAPSDPVIDPAVQFDLVETIRTAVANRPEVQTAILGIDDVGVRALVADNARLPELNLNARIAYYGLEDDYGSSAQEVLNDDFIDYIVGMGFSMPIGNRGPEANFRAARLRRSAAVIAYRLAIQNTVAEVKRVLRDVVTQYELISATRSFRLAQAENLRVLGVEETLRGLTPEFLDLILNQQDTMATARLQEVQAQVDYATSLAGLYAAMGTGLQHNQIELEVVEDPLAIAVDFEDTEG